MWRSFQFDENADMIDSYTHKVKQVAALLDYGEPQILELFKNTLPSRLYYMVYNINNLKEAVETAKCMLMKEQIDGHKSEQATSSPFMKVNQQNSKKKGVTFNAMETIQKQGDSIDTLTSLMNELSSKLDKRGNSLQCKPRLIQEETEDMDKGRTDIIAEIGPIAETEVSTIIMAETGEIIKTRTIMVLKIIEIGTEIPRIIDPIIEGKILAKGMTKDLDIEVSVENVTDPDPGIGVPQEKL